MGTDYAWLWFRGRRRLVRKETDPVIPAAEPEPRTLVCPECSGDVAWDTDCPPPEEP